MRWDSKEKGSGAAVNRQSSWCLEELLVVGIVSCRSGTGSWGGDLLLGSWKVMRRGSVDVSGQRRHSLSRAGATSFQAASLLAYRTFGSAFCPLTHSPRLEGGTGAANARLRPSALSR